MNWSGLSRAKSSLRGGLTFPSDKVSLEEVQINLLDEINEALGVTPSDGRLEKIEEELLGIYSALPKRAGGFLGHATVRYALHRFFIEKHGWFFRGLEPTGTAGNSSSPTELLKARVPAYIQSLMEEQLDGRGFTLRELTVLAATLEDLARNEAVDRLKAAYDALEMSQDVRQPEAKLDEALDVFMMDFIIGGNLTVHDSKEVNDKLQNMKAVYPKWVKIQEFVREIRRNIIDEVGMLPDTSGIDFALASHIGAQVGQRIGKWQDVQCRAVKDQLLSLGDRQVGRVLLSDFYKATLAGTLQLTEHVDYLRKLGSLDESVPNKPTVVVPNYLNSPTNCIASSSFYSVCCTNECEAILRDIERSVAGPFAQPAQIEKLMPVLTSSPRQ